MKKRGFVAGMLVGVLLFTIGQAEETEKKKTESESEGKLQEKLVEREAQATIAGKPLDYASTTGTLVLQDEKGKDKASIFFVAYTKKGIKDPTTRPITFVTNGGPGSSAIWLHAGLMGPQRVALDEEGFPEPPYKMINNEYSILDQTDLVFIDPVSTGFSRPAPGEDPKQFHGVKEDVESLAEFIRLYLSRFNRWTSPKFFAGESYGTTRAAALAKELHEEQHIYLNGIILISTVLDFQTLRFTDGNDLPYLLFLPTYTASAWYHQKLPADLQRRPLKQVLQEVEKWVMNDYSQALLKGDRLEGQERQTTIRNLSRYTGLSENFIDQANLRVSIFRFTKELLRDQKRTIGRFDSRYKGIDKLAVGDHFDYDPAADVIFGAFTAGFNQYLRQDLGWESTKRYDVLANVWPWKFGGAENGHPNVTDDLREVMSRNPDLRVFVANGTYDLATPYFATVYTVDHLGLDPSLRSHLTMRDYGAGHMMYVHKPSLEKLKEDLAAFIHQTMHPAKN